MRAGEREGAVDQASNSKDREGSPTELKAGNAPDLQKAARFPVLILL